MDHTGDYNTISILSAYGLNRVHTKQQGLASQFSTEDVHITVALGVRLEEKEN